MRSDNKNDSKWILGVLSLVGLSWLMGVGILSLATEIVKALGLK